MDKENLLKEIYQDGKALGACSAFSEAKTVKEIVDELFTPQGIEFCLKLRFPTLDVFRQFDKEEVKQYGVYIDCGDIELSDPQRAFLVGNTKATIKCAKLQNNSIYLMHGASVSVIASGFAIVRVEGDKKSHISYIQNDHAKVLA
jgi:hypothetical protein